MGSKSVPFKKLFRSPIVERFAGEGLGFRGSGAGRPRGRAHVVLVLPLVASSRPVISGLLGEAPREAKKNAGSSCSSRLIKQALGSSMEFADQKLQKTRVLV